MTAQGARAMLTPRYVHIGRTPAGVEWNCYPRRGDTRQTFDARVAKMRARFQEIQSR